MTPHIVPALRRPTDRPAPLADRPVRRPARRPVRHILRRLTGLWACWALAGCALSPAPQAPEGVHPLQWPEGVHPLQAPEGASGWTPKPGWRHAHQVVVAAHPLASAAGLQVLRAGGSAVDAAVAVQAMLGLVEPQSSGLGGGAFLLHHDGHATQAYDGRETAPAAVDERLFLQEDGRPMPVREAVVGGRSVGVPGAIAMLALAHARHGRLPWARLFDAAIAQAEQGFPVSPRLASLLARDPDLPRQPAAARFFYPAGQPLAVGAVLRNPAYAAVLRRIAQQGAPGLMAGPVADAIVRAVRDHPRQPGALAVTDIAAYRPLARPALCQALPPIGPARRRYTLCGMPPPSSGGLAVGQILGVLARLPAADFAQAPEFLHLYTEAARLAFADRAQHVADPDAVPAPGGDWSRLLAPDYLDARARLIDTRAGAPRMPQAPAGQPGPAAPLAWASMPEQVERGTSHVSIVDAWGHAVALTTTIEDAFGARLLTDGGTGLPGGFLLNNQLTDFSFLPRDDHGQPVANRVAPGKRPRSSMAPSLLFETTPSGQPGPLVAVVGSPGGGMIIHHVARALWALMHDASPPQQVADAANFGTLGGPVLLETGRHSPATAAALMTRGHTVVWAELTSGLHLIVRTPTGWASGADPRREGEAAGD